MARIVEDSDDEFPNLMELLRDTNSRVTPKKWPSKEPTKKQAVPSNNFPPDSRLSKRNDSRNVTGEGEGGEVGEGEENEAEEGEPKKKPKKRVLKQRAANPLLRPLSSADISAASSDLPAGETRSRIRTAAKRREAGKTVGTGWSKLMVILDSDEDTRVNSDGFSTRKTTATKGMEARKVSERSHSKPTPKLDSDEEDFGPDSDGLSDFIANDSTCLEEDSITKIHAPRSTRRLVKGRKPGKDEVSEDELDVGMKNLSVKDGSRMSSKNGSAGKEHGDFAARYADKENAPQSRPSKASRQDTGAPKPDFQLLPFPSSDIEDPCTLRFSPSQRNSRNVSKETCFATPPGSPEPKPKGLKSPTKKFPRIPSTPHRPSMDSFWSQDVINNWNDEFSPQKTIKARRLDRCNSSGGILLFSPKISPAKQDRTARDAKKAFSEKKHDLAESFLAELDTALTDGQISKLAASTGGIKIIWSKKLNTTAGRANWKRETVKSLRNLDGKAQPPTYRHHAAIELAEKVIDDEDRLLNVIAHEFCHLANFMISNIKTNPHGKEFKAWAAKCSAHFEDRGINVTTKHSYTIDYKYVWECENCGLEFKRHSKSIDTARHQCGSCKSKLVQTRPAPRGNAGGEKKISEYQNFVKENMSRVREENPGSPQKVIMGLVGKSYQEYKASKMVESLDTSEVVGSREGTPGDGGVGSILRELEILDLTSSQV